MSLLAKLGMFACWIVWFPKNVNTLAMIPLCCCAAVLLCWYPMPLRHIRLSLNAHFFCMRDEISYLLICFFFCFLFLDEHDVEPIKVILATSTHNVQKIQYI